LQHQAAGEPAAFVDGAEEGAFLLGGDAVRFDMGSAYVSTL